jgi:molecular chaperone GrpE
MVTKGPDLKSGRRKRKGIKEKERGQKLADCQKAKKEYLAGWQRARADFLNYKKTEEARRNEFLKAQKESFLLEAVAILDNFERAAECLTEKDKEDNNIRGFLQIKKQFEIFLKNNGLEEIKALGEKFDPALHEAVEVLIDKDSGPGVVVSVVRKGYRFDGRTIRPVRVKISNKGH